MFQTKGPKDLFIVGGYKSDHGLRHRPHFASLSHPLLPFPPQKIRSIDNSSFPIVRSGITNLPLHLILETMIRRLSASFFLLGMVVLVLLQQPAFAYCAHTKQVFITDCGCGQAADIFCPHCLEEKSSQPGDKCSDKIQLDTDDLIWFDLAIDSRAEFSSPVACCDAAPLTFSPAAEFSVTPLRPPPPPLGLLNSLESFISLSFSIIPFGREYSEEDNQERGIQRRESLSF